MIDQVLDHEKMSVGEYCSATECTDTEYLYMFEFVGNKDNY